MTTTHKIKTWSCDTCGYKQDFDPGNIQQWHEIFPNIPNGQCPNPACGLEQLTPELDPDKQIRVNIVTEAEVNNYNSEQLGGKTKGQLISQATEDRIKFNSTEWKA